MRIKTPIYIRRLFWPSSALSIVLAAALYAIPSPAALANNTALLTAEVHEAELSMSIPDDHVVLSLNASTAALVDDNLSVYVTTTSQYGYTLMMSADSSNLTRTEAIDESYPIISTLAADSTAENFGVNRWGYRLSSENTYHPFDNYGTQVGYKNTSITDDENIINFASRVNSATVAGTYNLTLIFNATVNPKPMTIDDLAYLQDFTTISEDDFDSVLASMTVGTSYTLTDSRDEQNYTIVKLANGQIWMTRNLAIGCAGSGDTYSNNFSAKSLTSANSNIASAWTTSTTSLASGASFSEPYQTCNSTHGAYYNINAVSAGTVSNSPSSLTSITYDICPKGWKLPNSSEAQSLVSAIGSSPSTFNPTTSGYWADGTYQAEALSLWWSSALRNASSGMYNFIMYSGGTLRYTDNWGSRGFNVRCLLK
ncbi:MAG: FISUMP domain-containing protein [Candidatus Saccharibacteria bacterium]|nr:FISUMP domain-containing protein [Candidatus Saccharibacteria bacterium]